jgi:hypothetical protein
VAKGFAGEWGAGQLVDELDQSGIGHALDEDTFRQGVHCTENLSVAALFE